MPSSTRVRADGWKGEDIADNKECRRVVQAPARTPPGQQSVETDVAKVLRCSQVAYGMYELGKRRTSVDNLVKLARYYHVSLDYLAGLQDQG